MKRFLALVLFTALLLGTVSSSATPAYAADIDAPQGVFVEANKSGNPVITWEKVEGAKQYRVFRKTENDSSWVKVVTTSKLKATDTKWKADAGTTIQYVVKASKKKDGKTVWSRNSSTKKWTVPSKEAKKGDAGKNDKDEKENAGSSVTVWVTHTGKCYHSTSTCSNMKAPIALTMSEAIEDGYKPCSKCW